MGYYPRLIHSPCRRCEGLGVNHEFPRGPRPAPPRARRLQSPEHVRILSSLLLDGPRHRSRHCQHADLRAWQGHRARRALGRRHPPRRRPQRQEDDPGGRHRSQGDARQGAGQHRGHPADEGRRHRRLHRHRADAQAVHQDGPSALGASAEPADHHLRALRLDPGRAPRDPRVGARRRRLAGLPDRGADGGGDRRRPAGLGGERLDGGRHRRRHHRGRRDLARRHGLQGLGAGRRRQVRRSDHQLHPPQLRHADRRADRRSRSRRASARRSPAPRSRRSRSRAATSPKACRAASRSRATRSSRR